MSGLGRRSHYRKHLTDAVLHDFPEPATAQGERIAKVVGTRGSNQFEIVVAPLTSNDSVSCETEMQEGRMEKDAALACVSVETSRRIEEKSVQLAILPTKFRKLVWLKRNDFVIVRCGDDGDGDEKTDTTGSIRYQIEHILYKEQVKHLKKEGLWPSDPFFSDGARTLGESTNEGSLQPRMYGKVAGDEGSSSSDLSEVDEDHGDDGIVYDVVDDFVNTNRIATLRVQDSESDTESEG